MSFLLDTNVLSELRKGRRCDPWVKRWAVTAEPELHTSVVALGELERGVERVRPKDPRFAAELERWLTRLIADHGFPYPAHRSGDRPRDGAGWRRRGQCRRLMACWRRRRWCAGLTLVTRNVKDFADLGVSYLNPFEANP